MRTDVLGIGFDAVTLDEAADTALSLMAERRGAYICTPNPEIVLNALADEALALSVDGADLVVPDGIGIVRASQILRRPLPERVAGIDLLEKILSRMTGSVYFLGGRPGTAEKAAAAVKIANPFLTIAGCADGYFDDDAPILLELGEKQPDLLLVCLGSPKQELWMASHRECGAGLMMGLGGALDVLAGQARRAPALWRRLGLEWLWRLVCEPKRIKRQMRLAGFLPAVRRQRKQECKKDD